MARVYATWHGQNGQMRAGKYKVTIPARITNHTDDAIIPAGTFDSGDLQSAVSGSPSLDITVPCNDDPDNDQTGWKPIIDITFTDGSTAERYVIDVPYADRPVVDGGTGLGVNLRTVVLSQQIPQTVTLYRVGVPGGLARLNADGDVVDSEGTVVAGSGGGSDGADGADGVDGASAYQVAVTNGFEGTEAEWLTSLNGVDGTDGVDGEDGASTWGALSGSLADQEDLQDALDEKAGTSAITAATASAPIMVQYDETADAWPVYDTNPDKVRFFMCSAIADISANPVGYNAHDKLVPAS